MENVKDWLDKKGYYNSGLRADRNHRIDLYLSDVLEEYRTELLRIHDVSCLLPTLEEVKSAITDIGKKSTAPDKETPNLMEKDIENGINWALNYVVKKSQGNSN
jgi:hypothetical protein